MMMLKHFAMSGTKAYFTSMRAFTARVFVEGLPADWSHHEIAQRFAVSGAVQKVNLVKNNLGQNTGKAIVTFEQESSAQNAQEKFDNQAVDNLVVRVKPFYEKKGESPRKAPGLLARRVYLMNLPYDATKREIEQLVKEFADIDDIAIPRDKYDFIFLPTKLIFRAGRTRGYAFVYLKKAEDADKVIDFVDGRHIRNR